MTNGRRLLALQRDRRLQRWGAGEMLLGRNSSHARRVQIQMS